MRDPQPASPPKIPFWRRPAVRWAASAAILALLFSLLPLDQLRTAFGRIPLRVWVLAVPAFLCLHVLGALKWGLLVNTAGGGLGAFASLRCYGYGLFGNTFLPSVAGGDLLRAGLAIRLARSPGGVIVGSVVDRLLDMIALALAAGVGVAMARRSPLEGPAAFPVAAAAALALGGGALCAAAFTLPLRRIPRRFRRPWTRGLRALRTAASRPWKVAAALALGACLQVSLALLNAWLGRACGLDVAWTVWLLVWPVAKLSAMLPVTQGGLGVREAALAALLAPFGAPPGLAVAAGLAFQAVAFSGGLVAGGLSHLAGRSQPQSPPG
jgi:uncharacterized membrane protein YbhN (UPF0104 family)